MFERLTQWLRGKAGGDDDPRRGGGWEILGGIPGWSSAGAIWDKKLVADVRSLEQLHGQQSAVWACVRRICMAAQEAPRPADHRSLAAQLALSHRALYYRISTTLAIEDDPGSRYD